MYYLRYFKTQAEAIGQTANIPTVAMVEGVDKVGFFGGNASPYYIFSVDGNFIKIKDTRVVCTYNVTSTTSAIRLFGGPYYSFVSMEVDGVDTELTTEYKFSTTGKHTVKYTMEDGVTNIGEYVFRSCTELTSVTIPDGVTNIGAWAFDGCTTLTSVTIPDSVTSIDYHAFYDTPWYKEYRTDVNNQYDNIIYINNVAYDTVNAEITKYFYKEGTTFINFLNGPEATALTIPNGVLGIGWYAFQGRRSITSVVIPDSVTYIGPHAFSDCTSLTSIIIGKGAKYMGDGAIRDNTKLTTIKYTGTKTQWAAITKHYNCVSNVPATKVICSDEVINLFNKITAIYNVTTTSSSTKIAKYLSYRFSSMTVDGVKVDIVSSYTFSTTGKHTIIWETLLSEIDDYTFSDCTTLASVTIPDGVTNIIDGAFNRCTTLASVTISDSVTYIGPHVFSECTSLTSIKYNGTVSQWKKISRGYDWHYRVPAKTVTCSDGACGLDET